MVPPRLVFIHGAGSNADFWHEQHSSFPDAHYLNLPWHESMLANPKSKAQSSKSSGIDTQPSALSPQLSIEDYADWVDEYVRENGLERVLLDGHSMGGAVALTLALRRPAWLEGLVLTGTGARLRVSPGLLGLLHTDYPAAVDMIVAESLPLVTEPLTYKQKIRVNGLKRHILRTPQRVTLGDYVVCDTFDVMSRVGEIEVPTLCVVGAIDAMTPPKYSEYLYSRIASSRLAIVEGAGHMLPLEKPGEYNELVGKFLREVDRGKQ